MKRMKKDDALIARNMLYNGKSFKEIIDEFSEYTPFQVLHELSYLMSHFPDKKQERMAIAGAYIIEYINKYHWQTLKDVENNIGFASNTAQRYMRAAEKMGFATIPEHFKITKRQHYLQMINEMKKAIWCDYMGYRNGKWNEQYIMTVPEIMEKYGISKDRVNWAINQWSQVVIDRKREEVRIRDEKNKN